MISPCLIILQQKVILCNYCLLFLEQIEGNSPSYSKEQDFGIPCQKAFKSDTTVRVKSDFIIINKACN